MPPLPIGAPSCPCPFTTTPPAIGSTEALALVAPPVAIGSTEALVLQLALLGGFAVLVVLTLRALRRRAPAGDATRRALLSALEAQRRRLARLLHDDVGQAQTALLLQLERAAHGTDAEELRALLRRATEDSRRAAERVRDLGTLLAPPSAAGDLRTRVTAALADLARVTGLSVQSELDVDDAALDEPGRLHVVRLVQDALLLVSQAGGATRAELSLRAGPDGVRLRLADDGRAAAPDALPTAARAEIESLRETVVLVGGALHVAADAAGGTRLAIDLPAAG